MAETTKEQLVQAAAMLLDQGGQAAVTLRAVAEQVGVSHMAPYRHFRDRSALLGAVAELDFIWLREAFEAQLQSSRKPETMLRRAAMALADYAQEHKARYRLLFSDPDLPADEGLRGAAFASFQAFQQIVVRCQGEGLIPAGSAVRYTGLIYATLHGAIDLELGGRSSGAKGLSSVEATIGLLFDLLKRTEA